MNARNLAFLAASGSAALLLGALAFQYLGGLPPCKLCIWQRWPHLIAVLFGVIAFWQMNRTVAIGGALAALTTSGLGLYHAGVEQKWWEGPNTCTSGPIAGVSPDDLLSQILAAPVVRCDEIAWEMLGISMAGWNAIASLAFAMIWILAYRAVKVPA